VSSVADLDAARFAALYVRHYGRVLAYCTRRTGPDQARDAAAETSWSRGGGWATCRTGSCRGCSARRGWSCAITPGRSAGRTGRPARAAAVLPAATADHAAVVAGATDAERALAGLSEADRELLMLSAWDDLGPSQIARVLGCSPAAARVRLHRARRRLADQLARPAALAPRAARVPSPQELR
jgi:RNA polymerase sigma-70 factor (ECF subfamily)